MPTARLICAKRTIALLKFARIGRHDIGKFINDNNDIGHLFGNLRRIRVFCSAFS